MPPRRDDRQIGECVTTQELINVRSGMALNGHRITEAMWGSNVWIGGTESFFCDFVGVFLKKHLRMFFKELPE